MERKFKHKVTNKILVIGGQTGESMQKLISSKSDDITIQDIIVNSNDWEEIIEKDYEILSFKTNMKAVFIKKGNKYYLRDSHGYPENEMLADENMLIHSVKRLSDDKIAEIMKHLNWPLGWLDKKASNIYTSWDF